MQVLPQALPVVQILQQAAEAAFFCCVNPSTADRLDSVGEQSIFEISLDWTVSELVSSAMATLESNKQATRTEIIRFMALSES